MSSKELLLNNDEQSFTSASVDTVKKEAQPPPPPKLYAMRWVMLFFFSMCQLLNTLVYPVCNPIAVDVGTIYEKSGVVVSLTATLYQFMHPLFTFPASFTILRYGASSSIKIGCMLTIIGSSIRLLVTVSSFYFIILGQILSGIGRPFILNAQASIAVNWFPPEQRTPIMTLLNFMITFSGILGQIIPPIFFSGYKSNNDKPNYIVGKHNMAHLLYLESALVITFMLPTLFIMKDKPKTPPTHSVVTPIKMNFRETISSLYQDIKFIFIFVSFSFFFGTFKGFGIALAYLLKPFDYHSSDIALFATLPILGGFVSSAILPSIYKKVGKYKILIIIMQISTIGAFFLLYYFSYLQNITLICISTFIIGFFVIPSVPMTIEWGCKQTYPINDSFIIGIMYSGATLASSIFGELITLVSRGEDSTKKSSFVATCFMALLQLTALFSIFFIREIKHRKFIQIHQSFHSVKVFNGNNMGTSIMSNSDIFAKFPAACPEGDPQVYMDITPLNQVSDSDSVTYENNND